MKSQVVINVNGDVGDRTRGLPYAKRTLYH
jgi:hypothetical protein